MKRIAACYIAVLPEDAAYLCRIRPRTTARACDMRHGDVAFWDQGSVVVSLPRRPKGRARPLELRFFRKRRHGLKFIDSNAKLAIVCFDLCVSCPSILLTRLAQVYRSHMASALFHDLRPEQVPNAVTQSFRGQTRENTRRIYI